MKSYSIEEHKHRLAAWAAATAARQGCRFKVEVGRNIIEQAKLNLLLSSPENLPLPESTDACHREWRERVIVAAETHDLIFTHGVAAKLINCYLKTAFVCGGFHEHLRVKVLHPPIDRLLLGELARKNIGGFSNHWALAKQKGWSNFDSDMYELVISLIKKAMGDEPLWKIEEHWKGNQ